MGTLNCISGCVTNGKRNPAHSSTPMPVIINAKSLWHNDDDENGDQPLPHIFWADRWLCMRTICIAIVENVKQFFDMKCNCHCISSHNYVQRDSASEPGSKTDK